MDFVMDTLANGRRLKVLTVVDDCTKEAIDLVVDVGTSGRYVTRILDRAARFRGYPQGHPYRSGARVYLQGAGSMGL